MKSKKIGMQALKIAIGSSLAIYIANLFGLKYSLAAGSVALLTMVTTKWKTVKLSLARVVTFIISVLMALIIFSAVESEWMAYGIYVFFVVIIAEMIGWGATISVNALIGMHFLEVRDFEVDFIANEFMLVCVKEHTVPTAQLDELHELFAIIRNNSLPKTREEFESRAMLYHILMDLEEFLVFKRRFVDGLDDKKRKLYWDN